MVQEVSIHPHRSMTKNVRRPIDLKFPKSWVYPQFSSIDRWESERTWGTPMTMESSISCSQIWARSWSATLLLWHGSVLGMRSTSIDQPQIAIPSRAIPVVSKVLPAIFSHGKPAICHFPQPYPMTRSLLVNSLLSGRKTRDLFLSTPDVTDLGNWVDKEVTY